VSVGGGWWGVGVDERHFGGVADDDLLKVDGEKL
jgi:hypothetical protein